MQLEHLTVKERLLYGTSAGLAVAAMATSLACMWQRAEWSAYDDAARMASGDKAYTAESLNTEIDAAAQGSLEKAAQYVGVSLLLGVASVATSGVARTIRSREFT